MGFRRIAPTLLLSIILMLLCVSVLPCQDNRDQVVTVAADPLLTEARDLSKEGKLQEAAGVYTKWLAENCGHPDFGLILIEAADSQLSVERALELLRVYTPRVQDPQQRELCRASQIDLLEMLGRTEQALGLLRSFPPTPKWLYRQAQLLYQEGLAEEAEKSLQQALKALLSDDNGEIDQNIGQNRELEARIRLLQARIFVMLGRGDEAENLLELLSVKYGDTDLGPGILLAYYEYLLVRGKKEAADIQLAMLVRKFPDSPELALARAGEGRTESGEGEIGYAPIPSRLLPMDLTSPQEGKSSDKDREQAEGQSAAEPEPKHSQSPAAEPERAQPAAPAQSPAASQSGTPAKSPPEAKLAAGRNHPNEANPSPEAKPQAEAKPPDPTALVQTGSFRDRENAEYMVRDLEASGFEAVILEKTIGGTHYYRVVIGPLMTVEQAQTVLMKLKDASFEGVLLFPE
jgi:cell division septation protein DedD/thioredoxin-like negative regulator of GroEL